MRSSVILLSAFIVAGCQQPAAEPDLAPRVSINPADGRPYSQAVQVGDTYWFSGKIGVTPETQGMPEGRAAAETRNIMESFGQLFSELGMDFGDVVQGTVYLVDIADYQGMNEVYGEYFPSDAPARETVAVKDLVAGAAVEISFVAVKR
ncbi:MAG: Rid family hydrolase [Gemmatimonadota bacterium]|nr:Rid family hydrolase [Gemmatimonadota bacterium]MDH5759682.1 Rid family hydrolase [Gemmatimonadota bacterium]